MSDTPTFDPRWDITYSPFSKRMGENPRMVLRQMDDTNAQVYAMTRKVVSLEQEIHELRSQIAILQKDTTIIANTADDTPKRGPGRPRKDSDGNLD